jgi:hypothetical protein
LPKIEVSLLQPMEEPGEKCTVVFVTELANECVCVEGGRGGVANLLPLTSYT